MNGIENTATSTATQDAYGTVASSKVILYDYSNSSTASRSVHGPANESEINSTTFYFVVLLILVMVVSDTGELWWVVGVGYDGELWWWVVLVSYEGDLWW